MVRKLALAVALALGTLSVPAHALGLGGINSKSALNQNFNADIALLSVAQGQLETVRVKLASPEAFSKAGVERPFYLSLLKFKPQRRPDGKQVILVTSDFPIREPFLNFLIEINWPRGHLIREYTVLLDPPTVTKRRPPVITTPRAKVKSSPASPVTTSQTAATDTGASSGEYVPVQENDTLWGIAKRVRPQGVSLEQMMIALQRANSHAFIGNNMNRLRKGQILRVPGRDEILSIIPKEARQAYRQQQDEWLQRRSQRMQAKQTREATAAETPEAVNAVTAVTETDEKTAAVARLRIATARPDGEGKAGASEDAADGVTSEDLKGRLLLARENAETSRQESEVLRNQVNELQQRLEDMQKLLSLKDDQLARLQDGVVQQAAEAEKAAAEQPESLPEETSAEAQPQTSVAEEGAAETQEMAAEMARPAAQIAREQEQEIVAGLRTAARDFLAREGSEADSEPGIAEGLRTAAREFLEREGLAPEATDESISEAPVAEAPAVAEPAEEIPATLEIAPDTQLTEPQALPELEVVEPPGGEESMAVPQTEEVYEATEEPRRKSFIEENMLLLGSGAGLVVLLLAILLMRRKSKPAGDESEQVAAKPQTEEDESILLDTAEGDEPIAAEEAASPGNDTSFLSEFSPSDINALQDDTGEVDPVSEADVYIAYGRYQQAENLLEQALERDPGRLSIKHKLLEVHYATGNAGTFVALAQKMVDSGQDMADAEAWTRAKDMGRELEPNNPLFEATEGEPRPADTIKINQPVVPQAPNELDIADDSLALDDLDLSALAADFSEDADELDSLATDVGADLDLSLDLDLDRGFGGTSEDAADSLQELESFELELPELDSEELGNDRTIRPLEETAKSDVLVDTTDAAITSPIDDPIDIDSISLDEDSVLGGDSELSAEQLQAQLDELSDLSILDADLSEMAIDEDSLNLGDLGDIGEDSEILDKPISLDNAFDIDLEGAVPDEVEIKELAAEGDSTSDDEVSTKLELASAYVEMGDDEGARSILEEVSAEGSELQKSEAKRLLSELTR